jgi:hypothetical protein
MAQAVAAPLTESVWQATKTFFPLFLAQLETRRPHTVCVVGASDGKYVLPLARRGLRVIAIERDPLALDGGPVTLPGPVPGTMAGLRARLATENLTNQVRIVESDILELTESVAAVDAVWTSCSWHYSINHRRPLADFVTAMQNLTCADNALFGAEYMLPVQPRHFSCEHYPEVGELRRHFTGWDILWEAYTPAFVEDAHVEQLRPHVHRMGLLIASRPTKEPSPA